jgi:hypothetical protein
VLDRAAPDDEPYPRIVANRQPVRAIAPLGSRDGCGSAAALKDDWVDDRIVSDQDTMC